MTWVSMGGTCIHGTPFGLQCGICQTVPGMTLSPTLPHQFLMGGWVCPGCQRCYSPSIAVCLYCPAVPEPAADGARTPTDGPGSIPEPECDGGLCEDADGPCQRLRCDC